ncbi:MAG: hypothetical protein JO235_26850 [Chroococcidiopsidaceae cyanobacterium CP_BM_RX_35]|nr:hypothetical protein [Chroococcidiopsidaceae cyanobacterium CP_BM_RX_35]
MQICVSIDLESLVDIGMSGSIARLLDSTRLLFDLQRGNEIAQGFSGCLEPEMISCRVTDGLVEKFDIRYTRCVLGCRLRIRCSFPFLQLAFTHLSFLAGLTVCDATDAEIPLLTDDITQVQTAKQVLWIQGGQALATGIKAKIDLSTSPGQLREAVEAVARGELSLMGKCSNCSQNESWKL